MNFTSKLKLSYWPKKLFHQLSIRQKIVCGYGLSLGMAILGITAGLVIGDRYYQAARNKMIIADEESHLFNNLQGELLEIHTHQQELLTLLAKKQAVKPIITNFNQHLDHSEKLLSELEEFSQTHNYNEIQNFLQKHHRNLSIYFQSLKSLNQQIASLSSQPDGAAKGQQLVLEFYQSPIFQEFSGFTHELTDFAATVSKRQEAADLEQNQADILQVRIIAISIFLSCAIAVILALSTSRIIVRPLNQVTKVAQKVTEENNFDLQVIINSQDEIGTLATALNQLIYQVKILLAAQKKEAQTQLIQHEKMSSLGRMLTGVAHEINNPVNFISGNLIHASNYFQDLLTLVQTYQTEIPEPPTPVQELIEEIDLEFLASDVPKLFQSMEMGADRTREIVRSLKDFSRLDEGEPQAVDLHACIESTLLILNNRIKHGYKIVRNYGKIPFVPGYTGLLYQVFMNILTNAIDALEEKYNQNPEFKPEITITTEKEGDNQVAVKIADNGPGISPEHKNKIFDNFFTTKPRGIGTGLGLSISYQIVVEKHQGKLTFTSELNQGTEFIIALPLTKS
ncbi:MAG TPA: ATP-binding protein [Nostocaceae cyanobacterium]|nr:ATP-binding protein [Nostocaceae cyanobacterium]